MNISTLLSGVVALFWVGFLAVIVLIVARASRNQPVRNATVFLFTSLLLALVTTALNSGLVFIQPDERGVVISAVAPKGYRELALTPGLRWIIPFAEHVVTYPISKQTYTMSKTTNEGQIQGDDSITARTLDGQEIFVDASVIFAIDPNQVVSVHINWQNRYDNDLVRAQSRGVIRDVVSQYKVDEVVSTKRLDMSAKIRDALGNKLTENGLMLIDFILRNITFSPEYAASVEQKQVAEQQAQRSKLVVEQKIQEAEQARQEAQGLADAAVIASKGAASARIIQAEAEAQANNLIAASIKNNPDLLTWLYIQKLAPSIQTMLLPSNAPFIFPIPQLTPSASTGSSSSTDSSSSQPVVPAPTPEPSPTPTPSQ
jgi:regulator of protease activity HflC (stomatin/prohibitin superfamily)